MTIPVNCECGLRYQTGEENAGRPARCPDCGRGLTISRANVLSEPARRPTEIEPLPSAMSRDALISLVLGIVSIMCAVIAGIPAIAFGCIALSDIKKSRGRMLGRGAAVWGIALGIFGSTVTTVALMLPVYRMGNEWIRQQECAANLKRLALALHNYENEQGFFPAAAITDRQGTPMLSWRVAILPYLGPEEAALYRQFRLNEPWDSPNNRPLLDKMPAVYACPDEPSAKLKTTNYLVVVGAGKLFTGKRKGAKLHEITAGTSQTLMVTESDKAVPWTSPEEIMADSVEEGGESGSRHPSGYHAMMADGSVRYMNTEGFEKAPRSTATGNGRGAINGAASLPRPASK